MKGAIEDAVRSIGFAGVTIVRPPSLIRPHTDRLGERVTIFLIRLLNIFGIARSMKPISTVSVAAAMANVAASPYRGVQLLGTQEILAWAEQSAHSPI